MPLAALAVVSCTSLEKLVVKNNAMIEHVLPVVLVSRCASLFRSNKSVISRLPLSNLRTLAIQTPSQTDEDMFPASQWRNHNWIETVTRLPKIDSIEVFDGSLPEGIEKSLLSSLKYLTVTSLPFACDEENIRCILGICPFLESLDLTTRPEVLRDEESSSWSAIDEVSSRNGANLRKFRFDNLSHPSAPGLLDVSSLRKLRYLAVPVDALVALYECYDTFGPAFYQHKVFTGNRHGCGSVHDIEDMWAEIILDKRDTALRYGSEIAGEDDEEEEVTRLMLDTGPNVPFFHLLPDNLQHLRLLDDADTVDIATYADGKLRDLVSHPGSSELGDVQVRRRAFFTEHVRNIGWHVERRPFWNVMRRV